MWTYDVRMDLPANPTPPDNEPMEIVAPLCAVFRARLKADGLKYTPERAKVLDTIISMDGIFHADELYLQVRQAGYSVSRATMYRTMRLLHDAGIIQPVMVDREQTHYQLAYGRRPQDLLVRTDTNEIQTVELPGLVQSIEELCKSMGLTMRGHRLHIFAEKD